MTGRIVKPKSPMPPELPQETQTSLVDMAQPPTPPPAFANINIPDQPDVPVRKPQLDPRRHAYRNDIAAQSLEGKIAAPNYVMGYTAQVMRGAVPVRKSPDVSRGLETEALYGETLTVYDESEGWAWVQLVRDGYIGYIPADAITRQTMQPTHRVQALGTFLYPVPDIKSPPLTHLAMNAVVAVRDSDDRFAALEQGGYIVSRHVAALDRPARDFVDIAERFISTPYLWGGRTRIGIDCSGLVQTALQAAGLACPRDSDMQQAELGYLVPMPADLDRLQRGDIVFWNGHVGIMIDSVMMVHANAHHMMVAAEPLQEAASRIDKADGGKITAIKRIASLGS